MTNTIHPIEALSREHDSLNEHVCRTEPNASFMCGGGVRWASDAQSIRHDSFNRHGAKDAVAAVDVIVTMRAIVTMSINVQ